LQVQQKGGSSNSANWRTRTFAYDSLSKLASANNPESGSIGYNYDADGNMVTKTGPKPNQGSPSVTVVTTASYDKLNRLSQKSYNDGTTPTLNLWYDSNPASGCTPMPPGVTDAYPIGRRTAMCDGSGATSWKHDKMGRVLSERRTIGAVSGDFETDTYNLDGSPTNVTTLGYGVSYAYSGAGRPLSATNYTGGTNKFVSGATYAPPGELAAMTMGSTSSFAGIVTTNAYNLRLEPILLSAGVSGQNPVFSECFDFHLGVAVNTSPCSFSAYATGDNGNVSQIVNNRDNTRNENFTYDSLNRIASGYSSGTQWGETFTIDGWGNLTNRAGISGKTYYEPLNCPANTNNQLTTCSYGYDAAGNMTSNTTASYVYDAENRLIATAGYSYIYDGDGKRVEKCTEGTTPGTCASGATGTLYWRGVSSDPLSETDLAGNVQNNYVFFNGQRVARRDSAGLIHYYFSDNLGSHGVVENATGTTCEQDIDYYPYGGVANDYCPNGAQSYKFTGKERDGESNLDYLGARHHASSLSRFMSPDSLYLEIDRLVDPQQLNLYTYGRNNPLKVTDLTGLNIICGGARCADYLKALQKATSLKLAYGKNGKVVVEGDVDQKGLSKSDKAILNAINDNKHTVTINAIGGGKDASVFFGASHGASHTINFDQTSLLDGPKNTGGMTSAGLVGHETLEAYAESKGDSLSEAHDYATGKGFPGLDPGRVTGLYGNAQTGMASGFTQQFQVHGTGTTENISINFVTPIPAASIHSGLNAAGYPVEVEKAK
jgi:RHS repeat-associated protein